MTLFHRKNFKLVLIAALALLCLAATLAACNKPAPAASSNARPIYDINMSYDDEAHLISARQEVLFSTPQNMAEDYALFHVFANAFARSNNAITVLSAKTNRKTVDFEIYGDDLTLLKIPVDKGDETQNITLEYTVSVPRSASRLGYGDGFSSLCFFYPSLAVYDGGWRDDAYSEIGDPFFSECADFYVTLTLNSSLAVASSGVLNEAAVFAQDEKTLKTVEIVAERIRDLGLAVGNFERASTSVSLGAGDVDIEYFYASDDAPDQTLSRAASSLAVFDSAFGDYPYPSFTLVQTPLDGAGGMEYGAFATVSPSSREEYLDAVTHEIAHQWWYGAVGNDQIFSAWMDEGLSEFCTYFYHKLAGDSAAFSRAVFDISASYNDFVAVMRPVGFDANMQRPLSSYLSSGEYVAVAYQKGALLFDHLRSVVGERKFVAALREYYSANKFRVATPSSLAAAFKTQGFDVAPILDSWLSCKSK